MTCTKAGLFPHTSDCNKYYLCVEIRGVGIYKYDFDCPVTYVFDASSGKCSKDRKACQDKKFKCSAAGRFTDPFEPRIYYWCIKSLFGGFEQYRFECRKGQVFDADKNRCENLTPNKPDKNSNESKEKNKSKEKPNSNSDEERDDNDRDEDNTKEEENVDSAEQNNASREDNKDKSKEREKEFECTEEGTFADPKQENKYYICTYKNKEKGKFKKDHFKCERRYVFDADEGKCVRD